MSDKESLLASRQAANESVFFYKEDLEKIEEIRKQMKKEAAERRAKLAEEMANKESDS